MADQLIQLDTRKLAGRVVLLLGLILALLWAWFALRWYLGNTLAEYLNPEDNGANMARLAVTLAPNDPLTHWRLGDFTQKKLPTDQISQVVREYETAASLSPNDYRFWMAFGTALEQAGEIERGEKALRRALALAPAYAFPRWYLGNLLVRSGRYAEAFAELQRASESDPELRSQLFNLAWEVYKEDPDSLKSAVGASAEARAQFSLYLLERQRFEDGLRLWNSLSEAGQKANQKTGEAMIKSLVAAKHFHQALDVWNGLSPGLRVSIGSFINGGFEDNVVQLTGSTFGWQVQSVQQAQIAIDPNMGHNGARSLRIVFQVPAKLDALNLSQLVAVAPDTQYELECYVKTQKLESAGPPVLTIVDAGDGASLATSEPAPTGDNNWQRVALSFKTGPKAEAVTLRFNRASCGENAVCPIFGTVWYDDFNLKPGN